jgi:hypothetical protein
MVPVISVQYELLKKRKIRYYTALSSSTQPHLNPIERLWKVMNEYARNSQYFATAKKLRASIETFFK